jgi:hypothetical protein
LAFEANRIDGSQAIMTGDGSQLTTVAATGGPFRDFTGNVSINNHGEVVFAADLTAGGRGIFSVRDGALDEIIGTGDSLFGSTVNSLAAVPFSPRALNNFRQVGFLANVADGRTVWVRADSLTVTSAADSGPGSLRAAVAAAPNGATISFDPSLAGQTITLTSGELAITRSLEIEGLGADQLTVSSNNASRIFDISAGAVVTIAGMTMADGLANGSSPVLASTGGAILDFGTLTLSNDVLSNNQAIGDANTSPLGKPGRALAGGLANLGTGPLTISGCAFLSNLAQGADGCSNGNAIGGAFVNGMGSFATAIVTDSLFAGNVAQAGSHDNGDRAAEGAGGALENTGALISNEIRAVS